MYLSPVRACFNLVRPQIQAGEDEREVQKIKWKIYTFTSRNLGKTGATIVGAEKDTVRVVQRNLADPWRVSWKG